MSLVPKKIPGFAFSLNYSSCVENEDCCAWSIINYWSTINNLHGICSSRVYFWGNLPWPFTTETSSLHITYVFLFLDKETLSRTNHFDIFVKALFTRLLLDEGFILLIFLNVVICSTSIIDSIAKAGGSMVRASIKLRTMCLVSRLFITQPLLHLIMRIIVLYLAFFMLRSLLTLITSLHTFPHV